MRRSPDRILTTHTGSLPRPADLDQLIADRETGKDVDAAAFDSRVTEAVADIVASQLAAGVSVISDGEMGKSGYSTYVKDRLTGFGGTGRPHGRHRDDRVPGGVRLHRRRRGRRPDA